MELCIVLGIPDGNLGENLQRNLRMVFIQCDRALEICEEGWKKQLVEVFCSCHHFQSFVHKVMSTEEEIRYFSTFFFNKITKSNIFTAHHTMFVLADPPTYFVGKYPADMFTNTGQRHFMFE